MTRTRSILCAMLAVACASETYASPQRRPIVGSAGARRQPVPVGTDEKTGPIEIKTVKLKQGPGGSFVTSGGTYNVKADKVIDLVVEWKATTPISGTPRLTIEWGVGEPSSTTCGLCRIEKTLPVGTYTATLRMDDGKGGITKRVFTVTSAR